MLDRILGTRPREDLTAVAAVGWASPAGRQQLLPVGLSSAPDGRLLATPAHAGGSASHIVTSLAAADAIAVVGEGVTRVEQGEPVAVRLLNRPGTA